MLTLRVSAQLVQNGHAQKPTGAFSLQSALAGQDDRDFSTIAAGAVLLIAGVDGFIRAVEMTSREFAISALLLSLLTIPIATELPEKSK